MSEYVHIVALDAPSPPDYGGAIDIYYKIVALSSIGKKIILHYFDYKPGRGAEGLEKYCHEIFSYQRKTGWQSISLHTPYIVASRINKDLIERLNKDDYPIILEGIHCTGILEHLNKKDRKVLIRLHNDEWSYYKALAKSEIQVYKKAYYLLESYLLKGYQKRLPKDKCIGSLSTRDVETFKGYGFNNLDFIPSFIPWQEIKSSLGIGTYCLYHGNMIISENEKAAMWLIEKVFSRCSFPFIIAGKGISKAVADKANHYKHIELVSDPSNRELEALIQSAHINVLPSFNTTGVKLKLLHALYYGRFCITNQAGVIGSHMERCVIRTENEKEMINTINHLFTKSFSFNDIEKRKLALTTYDNKTNAYALNALIS